MVPSEGHAAIDLPEGVELVRVLSRSERGDVLETRVEGRRSVLRVGARPGDRLAVEVELVGRVAAPGVVVPTRWGRTPKGRPFTLRPWVDGRPFDEAARDAEPATVESWTRTLLSALAALHDAGLVHRDVKADNVLVGAEGPVLVDLDLLAHDRPGTEGAGSSYHVAPEILLGQAPTPRSDLFSVGAMLAGALAGVPAPTFAHRFPARSFWEASALDPTRLGGDLGSLVRQLVRRHPADRPASARHAARLLHPEGGPAVSLDLPFLAGRDAALRRLVSAFEPIGRGHRVVLVEVADDEEQALLLDHLEVALVIAGSSPGRLEACDDPTAALEARLADGADPVLVAAQSCGGDDDPEPLVGLVAGFLASGGRAEATVGILAREATCQAVVEALRRRHLHDEVGDVHLTSWPRVPVGAVASHISELLGGSGGAASQHLARSLHEATIGRHADLLRCLLRAVEVGVLRAEGSAYTLLRTDWPAEAVPASDADALPDVSGDARAVLATLALLSPLAPPAALRPASGLSSVAFAVALAELRAASLVDLGGRDGAPRVLGQRLLAAARASLDADAARALHARCLAALEEHGGEPELCAEHRIALAPDGEAIEAELAVVEDLLRDGRLAAARRLLQVAARRLGRPSLRRDVLEARLELAQGNAPRALQIVEAASGGDFTGAPASLLLVGAHAAEQSGRRDLARALNTQVVEGRPARDDLLRARVGLAYAAFLDGDTDGALRLTDDLRDDDPPEPRALVLNVRGVTLSRTGRLAEAAQCLEQALAAANASGLPLLVARTELNRAHLDRRRGATSAACRSLERANEAFDRAGHVQGRALALNNLGVLQRDRGEPARGAEFLGRALALRRRVGDVHGSASSLGSLAAAELEAGHLGLALETAERARRLLVEGGYASEVAFIDVQRALALALSGRVAEAATLLSSDAVGRARDEHTALVLRVEGTLEFLAEDRERARRTLESALAAASGAGDAAERFRTAALLLSLDPSDATVREALRAAGEALDAPARRAEARWRTLPSDELRDADALSDLLAVFESAGRTDLVRAVALALADAHEAAGRASGRRAAAARAGQAADALVDGLPADVREASLQRLLRLSGPRPAGTRRLGGLTVDWLLGCNRRMAVEDDLEGLLLAIVDMALDVTGSRRGFLVLVDGDDVEARVARNMSHEAMSVEEARFSRTVVREAVRSAEPILTTDASADERFSSAVSIASLALRSVLCVPLPGAQGALGALYLDDDRRADAFDETDTERVSALADQASVAITHLRRRAEVEALADRLSERVEYQEVELREARRQLRRRGDVAPLCGMVGESPAMQAVFALVERVAPTDLSVLVTGPSGAGKDLVARAIHARSLRADGPIVIENVAAVPATLLESELFGHVRGAFTGADRDRPGLFVEADGGTFVLDEIGELPLELQPKLLRVLESGELRPVGSRKVRRVDVRIVAATNRDLLERVREGAFREDLYYRLNAVEVRLPSLEERLDDVPRLVHHFLERLAEKHGKAKRITEPVLAAMVRRAWPGQVRELSNEVSRLYFLSDDAIDRVDLVRDVVARAGDDPMPESLRLEDVERAAIERALRATGFRKDRAAQVLGISRAGLYAKMRRLSIAGTSSDDGETEPSDNET